MLQGHHNEMLGLCLLLCPEPDPKVPEAAAPSFWWGEEGSGTSQVCVPGDVKGDLTLQPVEEITQHHPISASVCRTSFDLEATGRRSVCSVLWHWAVQDVENSVCTERSCCTRGLE